MYFFQSHWFSKERGLTWADPLLTATAIQRWFKWSFPRCFTLAKRRRNMIYTSVGWHPIPVGMNKDFAVELSEVKISCKEISPFFCNKSGVWETYIHCGKPQQRWAFTALKGAKKRWDRSVRQHAKVSLKWASSSSDKVQPKKHRG